MNALPIPRAWTKEEIHRLAPDLETWIRPGAPVLPAESALLQTRLELETMTKLLESAKALLSKIANTPCKRLVNENQEELVCYWPNDAPYKTALTPLTPFVPIVVVARVFPPDFFGWVNAEAGEFSPVTPENFEDANDWVPVFVAGGK